MIHIIELLTLSLVVLLAYRVHLQYGAEQSYVAGERPTYTNKRLETEPQVSFECSTATPAMQKPLPKDYSNINSKLLDDYIDDFF